jgi:hypothetical protein
LAELEEKIKAAIKWFECISLHHLCKAIRICFDELGNFQIYTTLYAFTERQR